MIAAGSIEVRHMAVDNLPLVDCRDSAADTGMIDMAAAAKHWVEEG